MAKTKEIIPKEAINDETPWEDSEWPGEFGELNDCSAGSIRQQLDMCERGDLRGDDIQFSHGRQQRMALPDEDEHELNRAEMELNFRFDLSEIDREGDEMSGDEHSSGLQGDDPDMNHRELLEAGMPGEVTDLEEFRQRRLA